ncbi:MAG: tetratricopeptide repeat protein [Cyanobacteria bacterium REEB67]|nr:tetratricopeptide repeat protein [Cyanobacteria bacterium REEB67]
MTKKQYILIGSVALVLTLAGTSALILAAKDAFIGASREESNSYNSMPISKLISQSFGYDGKNLANCRANQQIMSRTFKLMIEADKLIQAEQFEKAYPIDCDALALVEKFPGLNCLHAVDILTAKAECEAKLGLRAERKKTLETLIVATEGTYNGMHERVAAALENLGDLLDDEDKQSEAIPYLERAYQIRLKGEGANSERTAYALSLLAHCQLDLKNYKEADRLYTQAIAVYEKLDGEGFSESQQIARENLANSYRWQNRHKEALACELSLIDDLHKKHLQNSLYMAAAFTSAADTSQDSGEKKLAEQYLTEAEAILSELDAKSDGREKANIYKDMADIYHEQGNSRAELTARINSIENSKTVKYSDDRDQIELAQNYLHAGGCALKLKDFDQARQFYSQALARARDNEEVKIGLKNDKEPLQKDWQKDLREYLKQSHKHMQGKPADRIQIGAMKAEETEIMDLLVDDKTSKDSQSVN